MFGFEGAAEIVNGSVRSNNDCVSSDSFLISIVMIIPKIAAHTKEAQQNRVEKEIAIKGPP
jgi:hypothetical protein